jgi:hypothetical protein
MKVLLVASRFPFPPWRGNQVRTVQWLDALSDDECLVLCPPGDSERSQGRLEAGISLLPHGRLTSVTGLVKAIVLGRPAQEGLYLSREGTRTVARSVTDWQPDVAIVQMVRCGWAVDEIQRVAPGLPLVFDAIDSMALHFQRAADSSSPFLRPIYRHEAARCRQRESELVGLATVTTAVSRRDLTALEAGPRGWVVPVAAKAPEVRVTASDGPPTVLLSGNLGYRPTVRSADWFAARVWPQVRQRVPSARWILAGARPAPTVRRLGSLPGVEVHGDVGDLAEYLHRARVAIAPMASGSGVAIKILEALAAGVPVVADPWSAAGLEDPEVVTVAENEAEWADRVARLLDDSEAARIQSERGTDSWRAHYEPQRVAQVIRQAVNVAVSGSA